MYYNVVLNTLGPKADPKGLRIIKKLACENIDLIERGTLPAIICRYATEEEKKFYEDIQKEYGFDFAFRQIKSSEDIFEVFNSELKQGEQEDLHLKDRAEIISKLQDGLDVLTNKQVYTKNFNDASRSIVDKIKERDNEIVAKFKPKNLLISLLVALGLVGIIFVLPFFGLIQKVIAAVFMVAVLVIGTLVFDYSNYTKKKKYFNSMEYYLLLIAEIAELNHSKNIAIHRIENMIDTLQVRRCLTLLPTQERDIQHVQEYLKQLLTLKSVNEIFSLH